MMVCVEREPRWALRSEGFAKKPLRGRYQEIRRIRFPPGKQYVYLKHQCGTSSTILSNTIRASLEQCDRKPNAPQQIYTVLDLTCSTHIELVAEGWSSGKF